MSTNCPYEPNGKHCNIVAHPDRMSEHFCATCARKVHFGGDNEALWNGIMCLLVVAIVLVIIL